MQLCIVPLVMGVILWCCYCGCYCTSSGSGSGGGSSSSSSSSSSSLLLFLLLLLMLLLLLLQMTKLASHMQSLKNRLHNSYRLAVALVHLQLLKVR